jgi:hypothetical protein
MLARLRAETHREIDDALHNLNEYAHEAQDLFTHPPADSHNTVPVDHPVISATRYAEIDVSSAWTQVFVAERAASWAVGHFKRRRKD